MKSQRSRKPSLRALSVAAFFTALLSAMLLSGMLPASTAKTDGPQSPSIVFGAIYSQTNLVSDLPGVALVEDKQLVNPWGVALNSSSPFWVVNNLKDHATLYQGDVSGSPLVPNAALPQVGIPNVPTVLPFPAEPTGIVANNTSDFLVGSPLELQPTPAQFIFVTNAGGINAWRPALGSTSAVVHFASGHHYTGVTIGSNASGNLLFVADFANGKIDVYDKSFNETSVSGNFTDGTVPANFHPYNIQNLNGSLYVTYAEHTHVGNDFGFVRKFDMNGVRDNAFAINNGAAAAPWGMVIAPANFGPFSNLLIIGNSRTFGIHKPSINAFNPATGAHSGSMTDGSGAFIEIEGLKGLTFGNGSTAGDTNTLYFAAGIYSEKHGLFGSFKPFTGLPASTVKFSSEEYFTVENAGHIDITVTRDGDVSGVATVNYATVDSGATQRSDYEIALGRLTFNAGETSRTFRVLIVDNNQIGGGTTRRLDLVLSNATGASLVEPSVAELVIMDNEFDTPAQPENIIDAAQPFVRQQYFDFLNREPDQAGLDFWTNQITSCGTDQQCIEIRRINVSAAFFLSIEFQKTGMLAYLTERAATGNLPRYGSFMRDVQALQKDYIFGAPGAIDQLEANTRAFFNEFVTRPEFRAKFGGLSNLAYVDALLLNAGNSTSGRLFISKLDGSHVVPPAATTSFGTAIARLSQSSVNTMDVSLRFTLSSPQISAHLHGPALLGVPPPTIVTFPNGEFRDFTVTLSPQHGLDMRDGRLYIDVHTQNFPNGEIRGQLGPIRFQRDVLVEALDQGTISRAEALRLIVEDSDFRLEELNNAFVLMEYFGYLRRNPDDPPDNNLTGYNFWLAKLNQFNGNFVAAEMVKAFIKSGEYRSRFGPP